MLSAWPRASLRTVPRSVPERSASSAGAVASTPTIKGISSAESPASRHASMAPRAMSSLLANTTSMGSSTVWSHWRIRSAAWLRCQLAAALSSFSTWMPPVTRVWTLYSVRSRASWWPGSPSSMTYCSTPSPLRSSAAASARQASTTSMPWSRPASAPGEPT